MVCIDFSNKKLVQHFPDQSAKHQRPGVRWPGKIKRNQKKDLAVFSKGKTYRTDLSASYNIGVRNFFRDAVENLLKNIRVLETNQGKTKGHESGTIPDSCPTSCLMK